MKFFSIITATYNAEKTLPRLLDSIFSQQSDKWELIVQDGGSSDGTLRLLAPHSKKISIKSEKDSGVYDAWNRALPRADSEWCLFLGADDYLLHDRVLTQCQVLLQTLPKETIFAYGVLAIGLDGQTRTWLNRSRCDVFTLMLKDMGLPFPATFIRTDFLKQHGFTRSFKIAGDYDFCARYISTDNLARLPVAVSYYEESGLSSNPANNDIRTMERAKVITTRIKPRMDEFSQACIDTAESSESEHAVMRLDWMPSATLLAG